MTLHAHTISVITFRENDPQRPQTRWSVNVSNLRDPIGQPHLRHLDGRSSVVQEFVSADPRVKVIIEELCAIADILIKKEGINYVSFGIYDRHGRYIAPAVAEMLVAALHTEGFTSTILHTELKHGNQHS